LVVVVGINHGDWDDDYNHNNVAVVSGDADYINVVSGGYSDNDYINDDDNDDEDGQWWYKFLKCLQF
jgi:hypothetical protein